MSNYVVQLGNLVFDGFSSPKTIRFGGSHNIVMHTNIGGGRVFDLMGDMPDDISFNGIFLGTDAHARSLALTAMRGTAQRLKFGNTSIMVVVEEAPLNMEHGVIEYSVSCKVKDLPIVPVTQDTVNAMVDSVLSQANSVVSNTSSLSGVAGNISQSISAIRSTTSPNLTSIIPALVSSQGNVNVLMAQSQVIMENNGTNFSIAGQSVPSFLNNMSLLRDASTNSYAASQVLARLSTAITKSGG